VGENFSQKNQTMNNHFVFPAGMCSWITLFAIIDAKIRRLRAMTVLGFMTTAYFYQPFQHQNN
jgi:hypothetical protein